MCLFNVLLIITSTYYSTFVDANNEKACGPLYLTVSAVSGNLWLNWQFTCDDLPDSIILCGQHPTRNGCSNPLTSISIKNKEGFQKTSTKFDYNSNFPGGWNESGANATRGSHCFPYWIVSLRKSIVVDQNCLKIEPTWMEKFGKLHIGSMMIPGTHNSGSWRNNLLGIKNYVNTQNRNFWAQLVSGIRFFDIRIGYYGDKKAKFWINHDIFKVTELERELQHVLNFLRMAPKEVIILNFHRFPVPKTFLNEYHHLLLELLQKLFKEYILPPLEFQKDMGPTLEEIWNTGKRLIISYNNEHQLEENDWLWNPIKRNWGDKAYLNELLEYIKEVSNDHDHPNSPMCVIMAQQTPNKKSITKDVISNIPKSLINMVGIILKPLKFNLDSTITTLIGSLEQAADKANPKLNNMLKKEKWAKDINIIAVDFYMSSDIVDMAIKINRQKIVIKKDKKVTDGTNIHKSCYK